MKLIYDDIIYSLQKSGGISLYWRKLEDYINADKTLVFSEREKNIFYQKQNNEVCKDVNILFERYRNVKLNEKDPFVFYSSYYRYCKNKNAVNITTLHDFTYEKFRHDLKSNLHKIQKRNSVAHSDGVICISNNTLEDFKKYYPFYKGKLKVIYHGYDDELFHTTNLSQKNKQVVFIGSRASYKNFDFTVKLLAKINGLTLTIIGGGDLSPSEKNLLEQNLVNRYEKKSFVTNQELSEIYNNAFALIYPSSYEGFGFPVIEAQACGCPVICQKLSSIPEVSGDKCIYVNSDDIEYSINQIQNLFNEKFYSKIQVEGLENVKRFSWSKTIQETKDFYNEVF